MASQSYHTEADQTYEESRDGIEEEFVNEETTLTVIVDCIVVREISSK